ncbi:hypothetical protein GJAV_G00157050 [Gymnothorax javanicus]|nr:hypothetical protein GJAV_G00157050 [Gymnothorax javanicus]
MDDPETRFTHLLQPIRDLTKNWEVDVASQLAEYLDELDQICISFDDGKTTMNFAEAALLIQGSACIYSKKVEYLYSLVYQALDFISNKKRDKQPTSIGQDGQDKDATFGRGKDTVEFLSLDDFIGSSSSSRELRNDSARGLEIVPLTPEPLIPEEEEERRKDPLLSHKGEVLASCRDFRMNRFTPQVDGIIRPDLTSTPSQFVQGDVPLCMPSLAVGGSNVDLEDASFQNAALPRLNLSECPEDRDAPQGEAEAFLPLNEGMELEPAIDEHVDRQQAPRERRMLRERPDALPEAQEGKEIPDPWKCHNPFSTSEDKPLKIGKTFSIPLSVQEVTGNKRKRKRSGAERLQNFMDWFTGTSSDRASIRVKKGPTFADLEALYWVNMREKLKRQKKALRRAGVLLCDGDPEQRSWDLDCVEAEQHDEERDEFQDPDGGGDPLSDHENFADAGPEDMVNDQNLVITASQTERMSYEDLLYSVLLSRNGRHFTSAVCCQVGRRGRLGGVKSWAESEAQLCVFFTCELVLLTSEMFLVNSQNYAQETVLSRRLKDWEEMIGPELAAQEEKPAFDIHDYGNKIMDAFSDVMERQTFASIVRGKDNHEVCRYMLASLQLANDYTVEIHKQEGLEEAIDTMELTLLSKQKAHERFKTYTAPSITDKH